MTVSDVDGEAPGKPGAPTVSAASISSLNVSWSAPGQRRVRPSPATACSTGLETAAPTAATGPMRPTRSTGTTATITGLSEDTSYQVQVQATNDEGTGAWSDAGVGSTSANAAAVLHLVGDLQPQRERDGCGYGDGD